MPGTADLETATAQRSVDSAKRQITRRQHVTIEMANTATFASAQTIIPRNAATKLNE
jgi:hypothetical protein